MTKRGADEDETALLHVIEEEPLTPQRNRMINAQLVIAKREGVSPGSSTMPRPEAMAEAQTPSAATASPASSHYTPVWGTQLKTNMSKLALSVLSPSPSGQKRQRASLDAGNLPSYPRPGEGVPSSSHRQVSSSHRPSEEYDGGTDSKDIRVSTDRKIIQYLFDKQKGYLEKEPELTQHYQDLLQHHE